MGTFYPGADRTHHSPIKHPKRTTTRGVVIHWTVGHEAGDLQALTGGQVDVQFYVTKAGKVYQLLDADSCAWHAFATANDTTVGIEHEGSGEPYTKVQLEASAKLVAWLCKHYGIPVKHVDPHKNWHGIMGHRDLHGIDGNNHTDTVPNGTGWVKYLDAVHTAGTPIPKPKVTKARLTALRKWILARRKAGWNWARIKKNANWREYTRGGGK